MFLRMTSFTSGLYQRQSAQFLAFAWGEIALIVIVYKTNVCINFSPQEYRNYLYTKNYTFVTRVIPGLVWWCGYATCVRIAIPQEKRRFLLELA